MPNALIAGAGIGGLTAALCLARAGFAVTILERAEQLDAAGAGVQVSPNASAVLRDLDVLPRLDGLALAPESIRIRSARSGATLAAMPLSGAERRWGAPYLVVHRGDLQRALLDAVAAEPRITLSTGTAVLGFGTHADGVAVAAKQGLITLRHMGDLLIGADGLHSFVRKRLTAASADAPRQSRRVAWRALVPAEAVAAALQQPETALWLGTRAHLVHYPLRGGTVVNVVAIVEDAARRTEAEDFWSQPGDAAALIPQFRAWHRDARDLLAAAPFWRKWPLADRAPLPGWTAGRVALLGDAAHPMLPFLAQGAAQAIEDASALGQALAQNKSIEAALRAYDAKRRARATRVQAASRQLGDVYHLGGPAALARDLVMRALGPTRMLARYDWLYGAG